MKTRFLLAAAVLLALLFPAVSRAAATGFNQTDAGPYDYNTPANWVGGTINGTWDGSLTLTGTQTVTFAADTVLGTGLAFNYAGNFPLILTSAASSTNTITLGGDISLNPSGGLSANVIVGDTANHLNVDLGGVGRTFSVGSGRMLTFLDALSHGSVIKSGSGALILSASNSYTGTTTISSGTLVAGNSYALGSGSAPLALNGGVLDMNGNSLSIGSLTGSSGASITSSVAGAVNLNINAPTGTTGTFAGNITNGSGTVAVYKESPGTLILAGSNSYTGMTDFFNTLKAGSDYAFTGAGSLNVHTGATFDLNGFNAAFTSMSFSVGTITNSGSSLKTLTIGTPGSYGGLFTGSNLAIAVNTGNSGSVWNLVISNASNTFGGGLTLSSSAGANGGPRLWEGGTPNKLGTGPITIGDGLSANEKGQIWFNISNRTFSTNLVVSATGGMDAGTGAIRNEGTGNIYSGSITLNKDLRISSIQGIYNITITGKITGTGGLGIDCANQPLSSSYANTTILSNTANDYAGDTTVKQMGKLKLGASNVISNGAGKGNVTINANGCFDLNGFNEAINGLAGSGTVDIVSAGGSSTLTVGNADVSSTFRGVIQDTTGALALVKTGTGTLTLSGSNSHSGGTTLNAGILDAVSVGNGALTINSGTAILRSNQAISSLTASAGSTLIMAISRANPALATGYIAVSSSVSVNGANLVISRAGVEAGDTVKLFNRAVTGLASVTLPPGYTFTNNLPVDGSITVTTVPNAWNALFVSGTGSDSNAGTMVAPFKTITAAIPMMNPGDTLFVRSGTYRETVVVSKSGSAGAPLTIAAYNNENAVISGADVVSGPWTVYNGQIYQITMPWTMDDAAHSWHKGVGGNQIFVDGTMMVEARWPNLPADRHPAQVTRNDMERPTQGLLTGTDATTSTYQYICTSVPGANNALAGAMMNYLAGSMWTAASGTITQSTGTSVSWQKLGPPNTFAIHGDYPYVPRVNDAFFLYGLLSFLDTNREWFRDPNTGALYLWTPAGDSPANHVVEAKRRDLAFDLGSQSYITLKNLQIFGAGINTSANGSNIVLDGIDAQYVSHATWIPGGYVNPVNNSSFWPFNGQLPSGIELSGSNSVCKNSIIQYSAAGGLVLCANNCSAIDNAILDVGYSSNGTGLSLTGTNITVTGNTLRGTGYLQLLDAYNCDTLSIKYNDLSEAQRQCMDNGTIFSGGTMSNVEVAYNFLHDVLGLTKADGFGGYWGGTALYMGDTLINFSVHHNVAWNATGVSLFPQSQSSGMVLANNTVVGAGMGVNGTTDDWIGNALFYNNICTKIGSTSWAQTVSSGNRVYTSGSEAIDPGFNDATNLDFTLLPSSPCVDAGVVLSPYTDGYLGAAPDIGAYEYSGLPWLPGAGGWQIGDPAVENDGAQVGPSSLLPRGTLITDGGAATTIKVFWGAYDCGTDPNAWANQTTLGTNYRGSRLPVQTTLSGLAPGSTVSFRFYASNANGVYWSDVWTAQVPTVWSANTNGTWTANASGNWSDSGNWLGGSAADGTGCTADFSTIDITADRTVYLDSDRTLTNFFFGDPTTASAGSWIFQGASTLTLAGTTPTITVNALGTGKAVQIGGGSGLVLAGTSGLTRNGAGELLLNASVASSLTGGINLNNGTLTLDFTNLATSSNYLSSSNALVLGGGVLAVNGKGGGSTSQTFASTTVNAGGSGVLVDPNGGASTTVALNSLGTLSSWPAGSTLMVGEAAGAGAGTASITTTTAKDARGIYGPRVVYTSDGGATVNWATTSSGSPPYLLSAYTGYTTMPGTGTVVTTNYRSTGGFTLSSDCSVNSLKLENSPSDYSPNGYLLTINSGGILSTGGSGPRTFKGTVTNSRVTAGNGSGAYELIIHQYNTTGLVWNAGIVNNGANPVSFTKAGTGSLTLNVTSNSLSNYSGGTYVNGGQINAAGPSGSSSSNAFGTKTSTNVITVNNGGKIVGTNNNTYGWTGDTTAASMHSVIINPGGIVANSSAAGSTTGVSSGIGTLTLNGGTLAVYNGASGVSAFILVGDVTVGGSLASNINQYGTTAKSAVLGLAANRTFTVNNTSGGADLTVSAPITSSSPYGIIKAGAGTMLLSAANTYTGTTKVTAGAVGLNVAETAGTSGPLGKPATLANSIVLQGGGLQFTANNTYDYTISGRLQLADGATGTIDTNGQNVTFANAIGVGAAKTGGLVKAGAGTLTLTGANTYTGLTSVNVGTLALAGGSLASPITVASGASLSFTLGSPATSTVSVSFASGATVKITGTPTLPSYTLMTASAFNTTPVLDSPIAGYYLVVDGGNTLKLKTFAGILASWAGGFGLGPSVQNPGDDPDHDGVSNLLEYALNGNPAFADRSILPTQRLNGSNIEFTYTRSKSTIGITYTVEYSDTLAPGSWTTAGIDQNPTPIFDNGIVQTLKILVPAGTGPRFVRLRVTQP